MLPLTRGCENSRMTRRRWIADEWNESRAVLLGAQAAHLARVLRAQPGAQYDVVAGAKVWAAAVTSVSEHRVELPLLSRREPDPALALTLLLAVFKLARIEGAIEKATELGAERILPAVARRTEKHLAQAAGARVKRWRRIAQEAAKQSRRADVPVVEDPAPLRNAIETTRPGLHVLLAESEKLVLLSDTLAGAELSAVTLAVGPEGGWTIEEEQLFATAGWQPVSLGPRILRAETAAIAGLAVASAALLR